MADIKKGADMIAGQCMGYQQYNRIKNHWRQADPRTNLDEATVGVIEDDSNSNKLYHVIAAGAFLEILQGKILCGDNKVLCADNKVLFAAYI